jgi:putative AlgH/UPF0301 family transcriptional regulator
MPQFRKNIDLKQPIDSECIPEILTKNRDVEISYGQVPEALSNPVESNPFFQLNKQEFLLRVPDIARFYCKHGESIIAEVEKGKKTNAVLLFLLDSVLAVLMHQRDMLVFHGTALEKDNKAILFLGHEGAGKSTLAKELLKNNHYRLISDGHVFSDGEFLFKGIPFLTLWKDMVDYFGLKKEELTQPREEILKYWIPPENLTAKENVPLSRVYILKENKQYEMNLSAIEGGEKLRMLWGYTSWNRFGDIMKRKQANFSRYIHMANTLKMQEVNYYQKPGKEKNPRELAELIEKDLES